MNTDHCQYLRCHCHRLCLQLRMGGGVEKAVAVEVGVEVVQWMKNCRTASTHRSCTEWSYFALQTVSATTTAASLSRGTHTAPCASSWPLEAASALTYLVMDLIMDEPQIGPSRPSSRHRAWRI